MAIVAEIVLINVLHSVRNIVGIKPFVPPLHREVAPKSHLVIG